MARGYTPSRPGESDNITWDGWEKNDVTGTSEIWLPEGTMFRGWNKKLKTTAGSGWYESVSGTAGRRILSKGADRFTGQFTNDEGEYQRVPDGSPMSRKRPADTEEASASGSNDMIPYAGNANDAFSNIAPNDERRSPSGINTGTTVQW